MEPINTDRRASSLLAASAPEGFQPPKSSGATILTMFRSGMDTYDIGRKLRLHEAVVLRRLTKERSEALFG